MIPLSEIRAAAARIENRILRTPFLSCRSLGEMVEVDLHLKCESFQKTGSFKARGALNKVLSLTEEERACGLITVSAGNHAQAVAWAAREVGAPCVVVMPTDAPRTKVAAVEGYGAEVIAHPERSELFDRLSREQEKRGSTFVHPFDDPVVLAGAGTTGLEMAQEKPELDVVFVPVGGGGIMAGVTSGVKALLPETRIVAVELAEGPGLGPALAAGEPVTVDRPYGTLADGMTPPFVGRIPMEIARDSVEAVVTVTEAEIVEAMKLLMTRSKLWVEASGAAATAALLTGKYTPAPGSCVGVLVSGGNVDLETVCDRLGDADADSGAD